MSTKSQRARMRLRAMHMVDGYGGRSWCDKPWHSLVGVTNDWRSITCPACMAEHDRQWAVRTGLRKSRGMWVIAGRRYRTRRLALMSIHRHRCRSLTAWYGGTVHRCTRPDDGHINHRGGGLAWVGPGQFPVKEVRDAPSKKRRKLDRRARNVAALASSVLDDVVSAYLLRGVIVLVPSDAIHPFTFYRELDRLAHVLGCMWMSKRTPGLRQVSRKPVARCLEVPARARMG